MNDRRNVAAQRVVALLVTFMMDREDSAGVPQAVPAPIVEGSELHCAVCDLQTTFADKRLPMPACTDWGDLCEMSREEDQQPKDVRAMHRKAWDLLESLRQWLLDDRSLPVDEHAAEYGSDRNEYWPDTMNGQHPLHLVDIDSRSNHRGPRALELLLSAPRWTVSGAEWQSAGLSRARDEDEAVKSVYKGILQMVPEARPYLHMRTGVRDRRAVLYLTKVPKE